MGRKLDALFGRTFKASKFKTLLGLAISRLAVLKNQRQVRSSHARSDVTQLLQMGHQERALLRVEHVIKEQNMFDAFVIMEGYCNLLIERVSLIENQKDCPEELKEAISGLIFASSRSGDFPELQQIRDILTTRFGKEFIASAVELRNNCAVNPKIIQKMSTRQPNLESRVKVTKEIASENGITLDIVEPSSGVTELQGNLNITQKTEDKAKPNKSDAGAKKFIDDGVGDDIQMDSSDELSGSMSARKKKYADVASAAQAAFESAAHAAAAARAAVELSKSDFHDKGPDDQSSPGTRSWKSQEDDSSRNRAGFGTTATEKVEHFGSGSKFEKINPIQYSSSESEGEEPAIERKNDILPGKFEGNPKEKLERSVSASSLDSTGTLNENIISFDKSDEETDKDWPNARRAEYGSENSFAVSGGELSDENKGINLRHPNRKQNVLRTQTDSTNTQHGELRKMDLRLGNDGDTMAYPSEKHVQRLEMGKKPVSVRTRRGFKL